MKKHSRFFSSILYKQYFKKILACFAIPCILFCIMVYIVYTLHYNYVISITSNNAITQVEQRLGNILDEISKKYDIISTDKNIQNCMYLKKEDFYTRQNAVYTNAVNSLLSYSINTSNVLTSVYVYSMNNGYVYSIDKTGLTNSNYIDVFRDMKWFEDYNKNPSYHLVTGGYNETYGHSLISVIYELRYHNSHVGLVVFNISEETINELLNSEDEGYRNNLMLKYSDEVIFNTFEKKSDYSFDKTGVIIKDGNCVLYPVQSDVFKLNMLIGVEVYEQDGVVRMSTVIILMIILAIILPGFVSFYLANNFYKSIIQIAAYIQEIDSNDVYQENELDYIYSRLKNAIQLSKNMEYTIAKNIAEVQQSQLISLQTQLNPHFLFNTLNAITLMNSTDANKDKFEILIRNLSNLLSYCLNTTKNIVELRDEIEYLNYYIEMEEIKYNTKIDIIADIPEFLYNADVPKFSFQPIIENTLKHGFKYQFKEEQRIIIKAEKENDLLKIVISDNGQGMDKECVGELNLMLSQGDFPQNKKIGILNVNKRIQLIFGSEYGCRVSSVPGICTSVTFTMPYKEH